MRGLLKLVIAIVIALVGAMSYFGSRTTNEVTGEVQHISIAPEQEVALGLQALPEMAQQFGGEVDHPVVSRYVEEVGQRVVRESNAGRTPYQFDFHVLADPQTVNAFALPGGQVAITVGLLSKLHNEAELAGVLGHEVGHVVGRHGAEQLSKQQFAQTLVGAIGVAAYDPDRPYSGAQSAAIAAAVAQVVSMRFGREDELESDALGVRFMKDAGYNPAGMHSLMQVLAQSGGGRRQPEFFSTHPNPENRLSRIDALIRENGGASGDLGEDRFRENVLRYLR
ncbi:MAG TPA: M48 family metallopeptidase [Gemmatimonadaceae bacterium]|nr:M48 family metallopeptidase [Gemmatimonadaceae bacterium]